MDLSLITCEYKIVIPSIVQCFVLHWYHIYLLHPGVDRTEAMILQHFTCQGLEMSHGRKYKIVTLTNVQNDKIKI